MLSARGRGVVPVDGDGQAESPAWQIDEMRRLAEQSGVLSVEALDAYERMVEAVQVTTPEARTITSPETLDLLVDARLVARSHETDDALYFAVGPDLGLLTMMSLSGRSAARTLDALSKAMGSLGSLQAAALRQMDGDGRRVASSGGDTDSASVDIPENPSLELITERHRILELTGYGGLISEARREFCSVEKIAMEVHYSEATVRHPTPLMQDTNVRSRTLYEPAFLEHEPLRKGLATSIEAGEQARVLSGPAAAKMKLVDGNTALVALTATGVASALLIRNSFLAGAFQTLFNYMWDEATPLEINSQGQAVELVIPKAAGLSAREKRIVCGLIDNKTLGEIARELKIAEHTVSRTIDRLAARLGVEGRCAVCAESQKRGYLD